MSRSPTSSPSTTLRRGCVRSYEALLFDLDGTLIDSLSSITQAWYRWAVEWGVSGTEHTFPHGVPAHVIVAGTVAPSDRQPALAQLEQIEIEEAANVRPARGARELLNVLPAGRWAIVTSATANVARARLAAARLPAPRVFVTADDIRHAKPDPEPFRSAAALLGVSATACLAIEDSDAGIRSATAAGCETFHVSSEDEALHRLHVIVQDDGSLLVEYL